MVEESKKLIREINQSYVSIIEAVEVQISHRKRVKKLQLFLKTLRRQQKIFKKRIFERCEQLKEEDNQQCLLYLFRSLTSVLSHNQRNFPTQKAWIRFLTDFKSRSRLLLGEIKKRIPPEEWMDFIYVWAIETDDPNIGTRNLELHFESQALRGTEEKVMRISSFIFSNLFRVKDLEFLRNMNIAPLNSSDFINGIRTRNILKPKRISYRLEVKDEDYGFSRVQNGGYLPNRWWNLPPLEVWNIIKQGLVVTVSRGKKGRLRGKLRGKLHQIKLQRGLGEFI